MARGKRYQPEQAVNLLRRIEVSVANGLVIESFRLLALDRPL